MIELLNCPFCGASMIRNERFSNRTETVYTSACEAWCFGGPFVVGENQLERWNRRASPIPGELLERVREAAATYCDAPSREQFLALSGDTPPPGYLMVWALRDILAHIEIHTTLPQVWICYCGSTFHSEAEARAHFGSCPSVQEVGRGSD